MIRIVHHHVHMLCSTHCSPGRQCPGSGAAGSPAGARTSPWSTCTGFQSVRVINQATLLMLWHVININTAQLQQGTSGYCTLWCAPLRLSTRVDGNLHYPDSFARQTHLCCALSAQVCLLLLLMLGTSELHLACQAFSGTANAVGETAPAT